MSARSNPIVNVDDILLSFFMANLLLCPEHVLAAQSCDCAEVGLLIPSRYARNDNSAAVGRADVLVRPARRQPRSRAVGGRGRPPVRQKTTPPPRGTSCTFFPSRTD